MSRPARWLVAILLVLAGSYGVGELSLGAETSAALGIPLGLAAWVLAFALIPETDRDRYR